ncbi:MAG: hypothetical protein U9R34_06075 [Nanoarchaeota archaeon]|nr:hypothetical protein [Nanoarchaeota archaeon]
MKKTIIIITLLILILATSASALNLTLEKTGETYATSGTWNYNFDSSQNSEWHNITWEGTEPANTNIQFKARTASTEAELSSAIWSSHIETSGITLNIDNNQWIEIEVKLSTTDTSVTPTLYNFAINYALTNDPICTNFDGETTNFLTETNLSEVEDLTLEIIGKGKIRFGQYGIDTKYTDFDTHVKIEDKSISINTSALDSTFNNSATLTFENVNCASPYVFYSATKTTRLAILTENNQCFAPRCTNIQCTDSTLTVTVNSFSGYAVESDANLSIDADDPKSIDEEVNFTADYKNVTTGNFISGATCTIYFTDGNYPMPEGTEIYTYNRTFSTEGIKEYNVTCSKTGYSTLTAFDNATIGISEIPEFSTITLGLGLIAVLVGLFIIRKRR